jgi:nitrogen regulatory protein PII
LKEEKSMFMIMFILNDPDRCQDVLDAWEAAGVSGVTILRSTGLGRIRANMGLIDDIPLMPSLDDFFQTDENLNRTLIAIIREKSLVDRVVQATQSVLGDLNQPNTGILVVLPVLEAYGLNRNTQ